MIRLTVLGPAFWAHAHWLTLCIYVYMYMYIYACTYAHTTTYALILEHN